LVAASAPRARLRVLVGVYTGADSAAAWPDATHQPGVAHIAAQAAGFTIDVFWAGNGGAVVPDQRLRRLAEDPAFVLAN
jgi:hypothetical protein